MPTYDYKCGKCNTVYEIIHTMSCEDEYECPDCKETLKKQISRNIHLASGLKPSLADLKENSYIQKVKDPERAIKMRKKAFGHDSVGNPVDQPDPKHLVRGKVLGGSEKEIDKKELTKALAKDPAAVAVAREALKKAKNK